MKAEEHCANFFLAKLHTLSRRVLLKLQMPNVVNMMHNCCQFVKEAGVTPDRKRSSARVFLSRVNIVLSHWSNVQVLRSNCALAQPSVFHPVTVVLEIYLDVNEFFAHPMQWVILQ